MHLFRIDKNYLFRVTSEIEDYFKEIGFLEEFMQYRDNYNLIKDYDNCEMINEWFYLEEIEERLLKLKYDELEQFLQFLLKENDHLFLQYRRK